MSYSSSNFRMRNCTIHAHTAATHQMIAHEETLYNWFQTKGHAALSKYREWEQIRVSTPTTVTINNTLSCQLELYSAGTLTTEIVDFIEKKTFNNARIQNLNANNAESAIRTVIIVPVESLMRSNNTTPMHIAEKWYWQLLRKMYQLLVFAMTFMIKTMIGRIMFAGMLFILFNYTSVASWLPSLPIQLPVNEPNPIHVAAEMEHANVVQAIFNAAVGKSNGNAGGAEVPNNPIVGPT